MGSAPAFGALAPGAVGYWFGTAAASTGDVRTFTLEVPGAPPAPSAMTVALTDASVVRGSGGSIAVTADLENPATWGVGSMVVAVLLLDGHGRVIAGGTDRSVISGLAPGERRGVTIMAPTALRPRATQSLVRSVRLVTYDPWERPAPAP
jgi:hypothetical protein